jgi:long-chain acyl-CoA synthetase
MNRRDVVLCVLPLFHVFGLNVLLGQALAAGASVVLVQRFDPSTALETIAQRSVTVLAGAPPMFVAWCALADAPADAFRSVRLVTSGAATLGIETAEAFRDHFGLPVREGYGLTEASPVVTSSVGIQPRSGSVGRVLPGIEMRVVDANGEDVEDGDPGELYVKGPNVFAGYWHDQAATDRVLIDGWLRTGDVVLVDDDGYVSIVDRVKDLIIVSGFNVYPAEVEDVIATFPGVAEVAVIGVPHPHTGEAVKAYVVPAPGAELYEEPIIQHCLEHLARYKCPAKVLIVPEVPRTDAGKLLRRILR